MAAALLAGLLVAAVGVRLIAQIGSDLGRPVPPQDLPGPVLLVPGYGGGAGGLTALAERIRATGRSATVVRLPGDAMGDLGTQAAVLNRHVDEALDRGAQSVDVIGHSAGGVVARLWAQESGGERKARRIVTLGSPHHGTDLAATAAAAAPGACPAACQQLVPGSRFLSDLEAPVAAPPVWMSVWTVQDETVMPPDSARLEGALNVAVQSICPGAQVSHGGLPTSELVTRIVLGAIGPEPARVPGPNVC
jgi:pimeloyl-ACP methyl ester carboxylesterase